MSQSVIILTPEERLMLVYMLKEVWFAGGYSSMRSKPFMDAVASLRDKLKELTVKHLEEK